MSAGMLSMLAAASGAGAGLRSLLLLLLLLLECLRRVEFCESRRGTYAEDAGATAASGELQPLLGVSAGEVAAGDEAAGDEAAAVEIDGPLLVPFLLLLRVQRLLLPLNSCLKAALLAFQALPPLLLTPPRGETVSMLLALLQLRPPVAAAAAAVVAPAAARGGLGGSTARPWPPASAASGCALSPCFAAATATPAAMLAEACGAVCELPRVPLESPLAL